MLEIFNRVFLNLILLQKTIQLVTSELVSGDAPLAICFKAESFQGGASGILTGRHER